MQHTTFWEFLKKNKIEIPIIQRDYAQGRSGKEKLREMFLMDMKNALDEKSAAVELDFVYGSVEKCGLNPLDGQQRLTTLWLLHWYIAYNARVIKENEAIFKRFTYETRVSSREFCERLSAFDVIQDKKGADKKGADKEGANEEVADEGIVPFIEKRTWFYSSWKQDPTIQAMLNMLGGSSISSGINDCIEKVFKDCDYEDYWQKLTGTNCPIRFYYLDLQEYKLSDDLYIKMNARGKALTNFENFKADLVRFIKDEGFEEKKGHKETIAHKLDTDWTDIFWQYKSKDCKIDELYFAFINRYIFSSLIVEKKKDGEKDFETNELFKQLYGKEGDDSKVIYEGFSVYETEKEVMKDLIERLKETLNRLHEVFKSIPNKDINQLFLPTWDKDSNFRFIPEYLYQNNTETVTTLTQPQRVVFHAICCYFEKFKYDEEFKYDETNFKQWMRVVWNIVENTTINNRESMIGALRLIDGLGSKANDIYNHLKDRNVNSDYAKAQMSEEKIKATLILERDSHWQDKIIRAENKPYFKGCIDVLLQSAKDESGYNIDVFSEKLERFHEKFEDDNQEHLKRFLTWVNEKNLPICCDNTAKGWKEIFKGEKSKTAAIEFVKNDFNESYEPPEAPWPVWKKRLIYQFDQLKPHEGRKVLKRYINFEHKGENDIFLYVNKIIVGAIFLDGIRADVLKKLEEAGIVKKGTSCFLGANDCGKLWIKIEQGWLDDNDIALKADDVQLHFRSASGCNQTKEELLIYIKSAKDFSTPVTDSADSDVKDLLIRELKKISAGCFCLKKNG